ncbi:MAG: sulfite exporter TauE/SafE family protein [Acidobacteria bacterium]|nr:sulfite exporter TauE/SafE family protein [Acidobacteriota bacterium]
MPDLPASTIAVVAAAGAVAGCLGALLGIGGGVFLVPFLNVGMGLSWPMASGVGLMTVIATSSVVSAKPTGRQLINLRLAMLLQVAAGTGALIGGLTVKGLPVMLLNLIFACVTAMIAGIMMSRLDRRNVILDTSLDPGPLGGRFYEEESGREVIYRTRRVPAAVSVSAVGGIISGLLGIGGGILQVPALNAWCGVPLRAAAATSSLMIGVTAAASAPLYFARGDISAPLAGAAVLGVLAGSHAGLWFGGRTRVRWLKLLMSAVLAGVSATYFARAL